MSILTDHPVNGIINNLLAFAEDERIAKLESGLPPELQAGPGRVFTFARLVRDLLEKSAPEEVSLGGLNAVNSNLQQTYSEFSAFVSSGNQANLTNALANLDNATNVFVWTFYNRPVKGAKPQFEAVESVRKAAENAIASIDAKTGEFQNSVAATANQLQAQDDRISQLVNTLEEVRSGSTAAVASIQQQFSESLSNFRSEIETLKESFRVSQQDLAKNAKTKTETLIKELETQRDKAAQIVQIVGNIGVTGNYQNRASEERWQANFWRWVTVALFGVGVALVTVTLIEHLAARVDLTTLVTRFAIAVAISIPAIYTARESARHRTNADRAKQTELELASLGPFLQTLPAEQRQQIIAELATSYFGRVVEAHEVQSLIPVDEARKTIAATADLVGKVKGIT